jgi:hypothetical protein
MIHIGEAWRYLVSRSSTDTERCVAMKIVVLGGTGKADAKIVSKLHQRGHEAGAAAPETGVDTLTGEGLEEALAGAAAAASSTSPTS